MSWASRQHEQVALWVYGADLNHSFGDQSPAACAQAFDVDFHIEYLRDPDHNACPAMIDVRQIFAVGEPLECDRELGHQGPHAWYFHESFDAFIRPSHLHLATMRLTWPRVASGFDLRILWHTGCDWT